jgi:hypothetical protein
MNSGIIIAAAISAFVFQSAAVRENPAPPDWITAANQPCKLWNPEPRPNESVTWSGQCDNGFATGKGILKWTEDGKPEVEFDGEYKNGKRNGPGVMITPDGERFEGVWVDDRLLTGENGPV